MTDLANSKDDPASPTEGAVERLKKVGLKLSHFVPRVSGIASERLKGLTHKFDTYRSNAHKWLHEGHSFAHLAYFGGVFWEGHGFYSGMGGVLLLMGVAMLFLGVSEGE